MSLPVRGCRNTVEIIGMQIIPGSPLAPPHGMTLRASRVLAALLVTGHAAVMLAVPLARPDWAVWLVPALLPLVGLSLHRCLGLHACRYARRAVVGVDVLIDGRIRITCRDGGTDDLSLLASSTVHPWIVVLNLRAGEGVRGRIWPCSVIIPRDACDAAAFRRLRVWLRWGFRADDEEDSTRA